MCVLQEDEVVQDGDAVQDEELQEEDQEVETWTGNTKACTCDCESAKSSTRIPAVVQPALLTTPSPPPPQDHLKDCMPGEDTSCKVSN